MATFYTQESNTPSLGSSDSGDASNSHGPNSQLLSGATFLQKQRGIGAGVLTVAVQTGRNLVVMDPNGKSDPYCVVTVGDLQEKTCVQYSTINPDWREKLVFDVTGVPQLMQMEPTENMACCCLVHYIQIDVWDYDVLNKDDFMGRIVIPIAMITGEPLSDWFPLGRVSAKDNVSGEIFLEISLKAKQPISRWCVDYELHSLCQKRTDFELPVKSGDMILGFPGDAEQVEMVIDDVIIEVSKHRGIGRVYLTNFRLVFLCNISRSTNAGHVCDVSMWVALNNIQSVDRGEDEKVVRRNAEGNAGFSDVKTLTIHCSDFRTIHLIFLDSPQSVHNSLIPQEQPSPTSPAPAQPAGDNGTVPTGATPESTSPPGFSHQDLLHAAEPADDRGAQSSSRSSYQVLSHSSSSSSVECASSHGSESLVVIPPGTGGVLGVGLLASAFGGGAFMLDAASKLRTGSSDVASFLGSYVRVFCQRLEYLSLNAVDSPPCSSFVRGKGREVKLSGWDVYDFDVEFSRQQVSNSWRVTELNEEFAVCGSYPTRLYIPAEIKDSTMEECASFRSKGRMPALCWYNAKKGNFIMRCAQPKSGPGIKSSKEDEDVLREAKECSASADRKLVIFDARSMFAAGGNMLKGKGTEDVVNHYKGCQLLFLDIPNIHAVRDSLSRLQTVCESSAQKKWLSHLESTQWLAYISAILKGAVTIARFVDKGAAALVHCSDGWDRTSQLTSLAQLCLDPYYRTYTGFQVLVEKEWMSFGHRFRDRLGHPSIPSQRSPVFLQFLDCVWQVQHQFRDAFEFSAAYLLRVADHINSQWFGNFLCNNIKERQTLSICEKTPSLWAHLDAMREAFLNPTYRQTSEVLLPASSPRRLQLWGDYFLRFDETAWSVQETEETERTSEPAFSKSLNTVVWVPDERARECHNCKQRFTNFRRRHHCRACGQVFCGDCTKRRAHLPQFGYTTAERVCDMCYQQNETRQPVDEEEDEFEVITLPHLPM